MSNDYPMVGRQIRITGVVSSGNQWIVGAIGTVQRYTNDLFFTKYNNPKSLLKKIPEDRIIWRNAIAAGQEIGWFSHEIKWEYIGGEKEEMKYKVGDKIKFTEVHDPISDIYKIVIGEIATVVGSNPGQEICVKFEKEEDLINRLDFEDSEENNYWKTQIQSGRDWWAMDLFEAEVLNKKTPRSREERVLQVANRKHKREKVPFLFPLEEINRWEENYLKVYKHLTKEN